MLNVITQREQDMIIGQGQIELAAISVIWLKNWIILNLRHMLNTDLRLLTQNKYFHIMTAFFVKDLLAANPE